MSPTVFRSGQFRFHFFSKEESRMHVHVVGPDGSEAKYWIEPRIELDMHCGMNGRELRTARELIELHLEEIREAWRNHFGG